MTPLDGRCSVARRGDEGSRGPAADAGPDRPLVSRKRSSLRRREAASEQHRLDVRQARRALAARSHRASAVDPEEGLEAAKTLGQQSAPSSWGAAGRSFGTPIRQVLGIGARLARSLLGGNQWRRSVALSERPAAPKRAECRCSQPSTSFLNETKGESNPCDFLGLFQARS